MTKQSKNFLIFIILLIGYVFNIYYLVNDPKIRNYQIINKVGIVIIPLGSVMGYVYIIDNIKYFHKCIISKEK